MMIYRTACLLFALVTMLGIPFSASAATTCSASMSGVNFGASDPFTGWTDVTATISYECSTFGLSVGASVRARLCFSIGAGRQMVNGASTLQFQLYQDAARTLPWPQSATDGSRYEVNLQYPILLLANSGSGSVTVYGRIPSGQAGLIPGTYSKTLSGADATLSYQANEVLIANPAWPASCASGGSFGGTASFSIAVTAVARDACNPSFSVSNLNFGIQGLLKGNIDGTTVVSPHCTSTTPYQIGLDNGLHASGNTRRMSDGKGNYVTYELYRNSARTQRWGNTVNADTVATTGNGSPQPQTIYGRVPPQTTPPEGGVQ